MITMAKQWDDTKYKILFLMLERPIEISGSRPTINEEVRSSNKGTFMAHQQFRHIGHFIRCARASSRTLSKHILVEVPTRTIKLVNS